MQRCFAALVLTAFVALVAVGIAWRPAPPERPEPLVPIQFVSPRGYICYRTQGPIEIDGKLDDAAWKGIPWTEDFVDIEGAAKAKPLYRTRVKMAWNDQALYIAAEVTEPHIWATLKKHDSYIFHDDPDFEVFLDPDGDRHLYAELEMNALNTTWDLLLTKPYRDGGRAIDSWEIAGLKTAVHLDGTINDPTNTDRNWTIEIEWPWEGLKQISNRSCPPVDGDQWRINFSRVEWDVEVIDGKYHQVKGRPEHNWVWSPQGAIDMHMPEHWGYLQFSTRPVGAARFQADPAAPAKELLHRIYEKQYEHRSAHCEFASSLQALGLHRLTHESFAGSPMVEATSRWFEASVPVKMPDGKTKIWRISADSRVWGE